MRPLLLASILTPLAAAAVAAGELAPGSLLYGSGFPELSAAAPAGKDHQWLVVADNEQPRLGLFRLTDFPASIAAPALRAAASDELPVDDIEAATVFPWDIDGDGKPEAIHHVFVASAARTKGKGRVEPQRDALFALTIDPTASSPFPPAGDIEFNRSLRSQIRSLGSEHADAPWGLVLRDAVHAPGRPTDAPDAGLAGGDGLNIEGLSLSLDGSHLVLGLRSPLCSGRALVIPLTNPVAALGLGESQPQPAALAPPVLLDLGGLGIRSLERDPSGTFYWIAAGPAGNESGPWRLLTWSGKPDDAPRPLKTRLPDKDFSPEAIAVAPPWPFALVFSDGGSAMPWFRGLAAGRP